ncbi:MAG: alpha-ketoacid dehydrogenase subunit beta, partial [Flavobacteriales bacterium]
IREDAKAYVRQEQKKAWEAFRNDLEHDVQVASELLEVVSASSEQGEVILASSRQLRASKDTIRKDIVSAVKQALRLNAHNDHEAVTSLQAWFIGFERKCLKKYGDFLNSDSSDAVSRVSTIEPMFDAQAEWVDGRIILRDNWEYILRHRPETLIFGEDVGGIGGVNQTCEGLQEKFGALRVSDTGIREATIIGQGIGMAMRGLRPIAEIQYLDYLYYALQIMRDDLATVRWRTAGGQKAPLIISTRGHRLEGVWHAGSPMAAIVSSVRGMMVCVPRNMTQAAGMYNTLLEAGEPALVVECLNGYRSKEPMPNNIGQFRMPLGHPEIMRTGQHLTVVSYGSTLHLCLQAAAQAENMG